MNYVTVFKDLMEGKPHLPPCICPACVYPGYMERSRHIRGRPYNKMTFFIYWLMIDIKKNKLIEKAEPKNINKKGALFFYKGKFLMAPNPKGFDRIPYLRDMNKILKDISIKSPKYESEFYPSLSSYLKYLKDYLRRRKTDITFVRLLNRLEYEILEKHKEQTSIKKWKDFQLGCRIYGFIKSKKEVTRTDLLRRFSNKNKDDLDRAIKIIEIKLGIIFDIKKERKKIIYVLHKGRL